MKAGGSGGIKGNARAPESDAAKSVATADALSFEQALAELESVAGRLEGGGVGLEESLALLKRGMTLIARCEGELTQAEMTLEQLIVNGDGELETVLVTE